jgi:hypothetical protein
LSLVGLSDPDHSHANPRTSIASRLATIVRIGVNDNCPTKDWIFVAGNRNVVHGQRVAGITASVSRKISQITGMSLLGWWQAVR